MPLHIGGFEIDLSPIKAAEAELARARDALHQNEKLKALGSFAAGVAHELNNPLAILSGQAELLAEDAADGPLAVRAEMILRAADRCARIVRSFLTIVRQKPPQRQATELNQLVEETLEMANYTLRSSGVRLTTELAEPSPILAADPDQLHLAILNLLINAKQAMDEGGGGNSITITTASLDDEGAVALDIADSGPGIPESLAEQVFEAFFTTKPNGTGIGLAYCRRVVETHGGRIDVVPSIEGAHLRIVLPVGDFDPYEPKSEPLVRAYAGQRALVIDDEAGVAALLAEMRPRRLRGYGRAWRL